MEPFAETGLREKYRRISEGKVRNELNAWHHPNNGGDFDLDSSLEFGNKYMVEFHNSIKKALEGDE